MTAYHTVYVVWRGMSALTITQNWCLQWGHGKVETRVELEASRATYQFPTRSDFVMRLSMTVMYTTSFQPDDALASGAPRAVKCVAPSFPTHVPDHSRFEHGSEGYG